MKNQKIKNELLNIASELITYNWPAVYEEDWKFPKSVSKKFKRKLISECEKIEEHMRKLSCRIININKEIL